MDESQKLLGREAQAGDPSMFREPTPVITDAKLKDSSVAPAPSPIMKFFEYKHLPSALATVSAQVATLAEWVEETLPAGPEKSAGLRKLLEAKDCFVRARL